VPIEIIRTTGKREPEKGLPERLIDLWPWLVGQWRQNPGFVAAAAAGSMGLLLTLVIVIQGGIELMDDSSADDETTDRFAAAELGEPSDAPGESFAGLFDESARRDRAPARLTDNDEPDIDWDAPLPARKIAAADRYPKIANDTSAGTPRRFERTRDLDQSRAEIQDDANEIAADDSADADDVMPIEKKIAGFGAPAKKRNPLAEEDDLKEDDILLSPTPNPARPADENPFDDEPETPRRIVRQPLEVDDAQDADEPDDKPAVVAAQPSNARPASPRSAIGPDLGAKTEEEFEGDDAAEPADTAPPVVAKEEKPTSGWHSQSSKPLPPSSSPDAMARHSRAVETVIYATPAQEPVSPPASPPVAGVTPPRQEQNAPRLALQISGPRSAAPGEKCSFEIRVTNTGSVTARQLTLSVELPEGLVHEVAQSIEQQIAALSPGQTYRARVRVLAQSAGKATLNADVAVGAQVATRLSTAVIVAGTTGSDAQVAAPK